MKRDKYLNDPDVKKFIKWAAKLVTGEWGLVWSYTYGKGKKFSCVSLYNAYENYDWPSKAKLADGSIRHTRTFDQTAALFDEFGKEIRIAMKTGNEKLFLTTAKGIAKWGGINNLKIAAPEEVSSSAERLDPKNADTDDLKGFKCMGAGYSKIYSAMIDDFPIYDSRVACALTSLIWLFCKDRQLGLVPPLLSLGIPPGRSDAGESRNPSDSLYKFPNIRGAQYRKHADSNLKAAWILWKLAEIEEGDFSKVCRKRRVRALEAALFMIGYQPLNQNAIRKT